MNLSKMHVIHFSCLQKSIASVKYHCVDKSHQHINLSVLCCYRDFLMAKIRETYGATYHAVMHHDESYTAGRPSKRVSGLYHTLKHKGAQFGIRAGEHFYDFIINKTQFQQQSTNML